jgi:hypothetical protein
LKLKEGLGQEQLELAHLSSTGLDASYQQGLFPFMPIFFPLFSKSMFFWLLNLLVLQQHFPVQF